MITANEAIEIQQRCDRKEQWLDGRTSYQPDELPENCRVTNEELSKLEIWKFCTDIPEKYFLYIKLDERPAEILAAIQKGAKYTNSFRKGIATTWTGDKLGDVFCGQEYKSPAFGNFSTRIPITVKAINGREYFGTYYISSGDYARVKLVKEKAKGVQKENV